jgi:POT family proton-dependent oligopeptide transporter
MDTILLWTLILGLIGMGVIIAKNTSGSTEWKHVGVIFVLALLNIVFWSGFEQAGGTFNFFARDMTQRKFGDFEVATSAFQSINAIAIFIFAPLFTILWRWLTEKKFNPRTPNKFAFGLLFLSIGFFVMAIASDQADNMLASNPDMASDASIGISPLWLVFVYLLHTWGELFISPIGLSMITKLSPTKIVSLMMGLWMGSIAVGNYLAAAMHSIVENLEKSRGMEINLFQFIGVEVLIAAAIAFAIAPLLNKLMKGIH